jgi:glutamyl-tRNA synthetase
LIETDLDRVIDLCAAILQREGVLAAAPTAEGRRYLARVITVVGDRLKIGQDIVAYADFFFRDVTYDPAAAARHLTAAAAPLLEAYAAALAALPVFERAGIEAALRQVCAQAGVDARALIHPARVALTGKTAGPGLFELTELLGRERAVERLRRAGRLAAGAAQGEFRG